ncbi:hypothetical protein D869_gp159 [Caulobacter phage CcrRogue]|uniref:Uncharacterized protein n=1 Tax=Caulobacter phage CcrRogue TaxID=2927986 RepID=K4JR38_9CAUD|nr:hypothetical protein D869_gp159 [Caulobacter phage CcrRogue]AFU86755.1 hypothetical protein CcrRogue_gp273 [Caulobacter phage CcrRogue]
MITHNIDPRIGVLNSGVYYAYVNGYHQPETRGTLEEVEIALGVRKPKPAPAPLVEVQGRGGRVSVQFGTINGKPLTLTIQEADSVCADVECGRHGCSLALLDDFGTIGEDGPKVPQKTIDKMIDWALTKGW